MEKNKQKISIFTYILVSVISFSVLSTTLIFAGAFFYYTQNITGEFTLGELDFQILNSLEEVVTFENGIIMPDEIIYNNIIILNARDVAGQDIEGLTDIFIKVKPILLINNNDESQFLHTMLTQHEIWIHSEDGFLYCTKKLLPGEQVRFSDYFVISYLIDNSYKGLPIFLGLEVEAVQANNYAYLDLWQNAPQEWKNIVNS